MRIYLRSCINSEISIFVKANHYSKSVARGCKFVFTLRDIQDKLIAVAMFGEPVGRGVKNQYDAEGNLVELKRLVIKNGPENCASWFISRCMKLLKREGVTSVISYADPDETNPRGVQHKGYVYRACNFAYMGVQKYTNPIYINKKTKQEIHSRALYQDGKQGEQYRKLKSMGLIKRVNKQAKHIYLYRLVTKKLTHVSINDTLASRHPRLDVASSK